jgi:hypothetical protein
MERGGKNNLNMKNWQAKPAPNIAECGREASGSGQTKLSRMPSGLRTRDVWRAHASAMAWWSFRTGSEGDFMRQEKWLRGNTRTLKRQYAARNWTFVRVLPGIAGYCRVTGPGENSQTSTRLRRGQSSRAEWRKPPRHKGTRGRRLARRSSPTVRWEIFGLTGRLALPFGWRLSDDNGH